MLTWIETPRRLLVRSQGHVIRLAPGCLVGLPERQARRLLEKCPDVRQVDPSAACPRCGQRFWCAGCASQHGAWVCACSHPVLALELAHGAER